METDTNKINLNAFAYIGDAVYEVFIRRKVIQSFKKISEIHKRTTGLVCATFQAQLLVFLDDFLTVEEKDLIRRARNIPLTKIKRNNQTIHRQATSFEVLIGYNFVNNSQRLDDIYKLIEQYPEFIENFK